MIDDRVCASSENAQIPSIFSCWASVKFNSFCLEVNILIYPAGTSDVSKTWYNSVAIKLVYSSGNLHLNDSM